jgi:hypothetical protein
MKAIVVYESIWGNTAAVAAAVAEGIGSGTRALSTADAAPATLAGTDLIVAGAPVLGFRIPQEGMLQSIRTNAARYKRPPDLSQPAMGAWLSRIPAGRGFSAAFETRIWWSPGGSIGGIESGLRHAGYPPLLKGRRFIVTGAEGPLKDGELENAKAWGAELAQALKAQNPS